METEDFAVFKWLVQPGIYRWEPELGAVFSGSIAEESHFQLMANPAQADRAQPLLRYAPLVDFPGLFLTFATTRPDPDIILGLADRYGMLLRAEPTLVTVPARRLRQGRKGETLRETLAAHAEPFSLWRRVLLELYNATTIWKLTQQPDSGDLHQFFRYVAKKKIIRYAASWHDHQFREEVASGDQAQTLWSACSDGDVSPVGRYWLAKTINRNLPDPVLIRFLPEDTGSVSIQPMPANLLQSLWAQLGLAVAANKEFRQCLACDNFFELTPEVARTNRRFCSISCKNRIFRQRQDQARQHHAEGRPFEKIAEELGTTVDVIKRWIDPQRKEVDPPHDD